MRFVKINELIGHSEIKKLYQESFPIEEQVKFEKLFSGVFEGFELYCIYEDRICFSRGKRGS